MTDPGVERVVSAVESACASITGPSSAGVWYQLASWASGSDRSRPSGVAVATCVAGRVEAANGRASQPLTRDCYGDAPSVEEAAFLRPDKIAWGPYGSQLDGQVHRGRPAVLGRSSLQHSPLDEAGRVEGVLRRGRSPEVPRRAAHSRFRGLRPLARQASSRGGLRDRDRLDQLRPRGRAPDRRRAFQRVASHRGAAGRRDGRRRPHPLRRGKRRGADLGSRRRAVRPRVLVRRHPPHAAPRTGTRRRCAR